MTTSHERFEEETRPLALLDEDVPDRPERATRPGPRARRGLLVPSGFVQAWAWWRRGGGRLGQGAARP